jgi:TAG lipase/steryl ester hydrolase/phospholipase A2/LPA acyltransferase
MQWLLPEWVPTKWLSLFTQPWEGDVTVVLPSSLWNLGKTMTNPTTEDLLHASKAGELAIWEKLSAIEANCAVEASLDACLARISNKQRERPLGALSSRIPSWLSMNTIGQQVVASWGNPLESSEHGPWAPSGAAAAVAQMATHPHGYGALAGTCSEPRLAAAAAAAAAALNGARPSYHHLGTHAHPRVPQPALHEGMADEQPPRVASWGSNDIADSVADFPSADPSGYRAVTSPRLHNARGRGGAVAAIAASTGGNVNCSTGSDVDGGSRASSSVGRRSTDGAASLASSGSGAGAEAAQHLALSQLECCDHTALIDIWSSLLPLASSTMVLEAAAEHQGLDVIAP